MKHLLLTMMALLCSMGTAMAEDGIGKLLVEGRTWKYQYNEMDWEQSKPGDPHYVTYDCSLRIGGSTVFDGKECMEVIETTPDDTRTLGYAYEQDGQVYFHAQSEWAFYDATFPYVEGWAHLYDFRAAVGAQDGELSTFGYQHALDSVDVCQVNGRRFLRQYWKRYGSAKTNYDIVVEGIGCQNGFLNFDVSATNGASLTFLGCYEDGECIFTKDDFTAPAVTAGIARPSSVTTRQHPTTYDLQGRRVGSGFKNTNHKKGMLVEKGRKQVGK